MITIDDIKQQILKGERVTLEAKLAEKDVPKSIWGTYSAFANTNGGLILLGVDEDLKEKDLSKRFTITGVKDAAKIRKDFWNIVNNPEKVNVNLLRDEDVEAVDMEGKMVVAIQVPRADYMIRPVFINNNPLRGTYKRNHEGDYHCAEHEVRMMMRDANESGNDGMLLEYYTMGDIDLPSLEAYRNRFSSRYPQHVFNSLDHKSFLKELGGYHVDRKDGSECLTMAGLLMFGKGLPIRERFDNLRMDYIDKSGLVGDQRYSDRLTYDGTWENNLFNFITMVLPKLLRNLPRPFKMDGVERDDDTPQHKAVREAMTNAVIHADLMLNGILKVEKYDNRFVFTNPGLLKLPVEQIYDGGESKARNQHIQTMLRMIGFGENLGSGFPLILSAWNEKHWLKPELVEQPELMQVKLTLTVADFAKDFVKDFVKDFAKDFAKELKVELSERQVNILELIHLDSTISAKAISEKISGKMPEKESVTERTIQNDIAQLKKIGILRRKGGRKNGEWEIIKQKL